MGALVLAAALLLAAPRPLDVVLKADPPRPAPRAALRLELSFTAAGAGGAVRSFAGACPWPDPSRPLAFRWPGALALPPGRAVLRKVRYRILDPQGRPVQTFAPPDPPQELRPGGQGAVVLHLSPGDLAQPGAAHQVEVEF